MGTFVTFTEKEKRDELKCYQTGRIVGPHEAHWEIYFERSGNVPSVCRLPLHLPNQQSVRTRKDFHELTPARRKHLGRSKLTSFFETNQLEDQTLHKPPSSEIMYQDFPEFYSWNATTRAWTRRKVAAGKKKPYLHQIGRIFGVSLREKRRFCLRKLLTRCSGAQSFRHLCLVPKSEDINFMLEHSEEAQGWQTIAVIAPPELSDIVSVAVKRKVDEFKDVFATHAPWDPDTVSEEFLLEEVDEEEAKLYDVYKLPEQALKPKTESSTKAIPPPYDEHEELEDFDDEFATTEQPRYKLPSPNAPNCTLYDTFEDACRARGFLDSDEEWSFALTEADNHGASAAQLRELYCLIVFHNEPADSLALWEEHKDKLSEDFAYKLRKAGKPTEPAYNQALLRLQRFFVVNGKTMADFNLPEPQPEEELEQLAADLKAELDYNRDECLVKYQTAKKNMEKYPEQLQFLQLITDEIERGDTANKARAYFLDAPGGTGKTYVFNALLNYVRSRPLEGPTGKRSIGIALAASGIAALLMEGGRTVHNRFGLGLNVDEFTDCLKGSASKDNVLVQLMRRTKIIVWDECTMSSRHIVDCVDRALQKIMYNKLPFGGKLVVFGGDFRQTLAIKQGATRSQQVAHSLKASNVWQVVETHHLQVNVRAELETNAANQDLLRKWALWLLAVGNGTLTTDEQYQKEFHRKDLIEVPSELLAKAKDAQSLVQEIYPNLEYEHSVEDLRETAILAPTNKAVNLLNEFALARVRRKSKLCYSEDSVADEDDDSKFTEEFLNGLNPSGFPKSRLELKEGIPVMVLRNLAPLLGICNGTRLVIEHVGKFVLRVRILTGPAKFRNTSFYIPRVSLKTEDGYYSGFQLQRKQFPVRLAYAMTINKSQGQTLKQVGLYLTTPVFGHGQLYVAFSRVGHPFFIKVLVMPTKEQGTRDGRVFTPNVVFPDALQ